MIHKFISNKDEFCDAWLPSGYNNGISLEVRCGYPRDDERHEEEGMMHEYVPDETPDNQGTCNAHVAGLRCGAPEQAAVHHDLPPTRTAAERRARRRQDYANRFASER